MNNPKRKQRNPIQKRSLETKNHILENAMELFSEKNFYEISVNEIIKFVGVPIGSFYAYFKNKKQLYIQVLEYYDQRIRNEIVFTPTVEIANLKEYVKTFIISILKSHKRYNKLLIKIDAMAVLDDDVKEIVKKWDDRSIKQIYSFLTLYKDKVQIKNLEISAYLIHGIMERTIHELANGNSEFNENKVIEELAILIIKYLDPISIQR